MKRCAGRIFLLCACVGGKNISFVLARQITESEPAWALFGDDKTDSLQRVGVRIVEMPLKENAVFIGAVKLPRSPARSCFADTLRTPAIMVEKGGSIYRTGQRVQLGWG